MLKVSGIVIGGAYTARFCTVDPSMAQYVYTMQGVSKTVPPKRTILENISLSFFPGAKIGVLGLNGAGKSSLLRIMAGVDTEYDGEARPQKDIKVGFLPQEPQLDDDLDVRGNVEKGVADVVGLIHEYNEISDKFAEPMDDDQMNDLLERQGDLATKIDAVDGWDIDRTLDIAADALRLPDWETPVKVLSGGERRRVALCALLLSKPDMLLLDEPTNHLDAESVAWLERFLDEYPGTVVAVTHDRYFLDNVAGWILELDRGHGIPFEGNYSHWLEAKEARLQQEAAQEKARQRSIKAELEWVRSNPKARQAKSKSRLQRFDELVAQDQEARQETTELFIPTGERLGEKVIEVNHVSKGFGDRLLIDDLNAIIPRGAIVGIIGGNGAGKSTFFRMLTGQEAPDEGAIEIGSTVDLACVDQSRDELNAEHTVWEEISDNQDVIRIGKHEIQSRAYVGRFNFKGTDQQKFVGDLSGGERNRVHLAKLLRRGANVILLDEPTNDLDVETLRALEEALLSFAGTVLVISHDRWFLDRVATHILAFEGDSHVEWFEGNFSDYEADRKARLGDAQPTRVKYKPIHR
jgi:ATP-binding cassette ChvD family protein